MRNSDICPKITDFFRNTARYKHFFSKCFVGITYGLSFPLTLIILDYWLKSIGVSNTTIGLFSLLQWPFTLKFFWGFFIDHYDIPYLSNKYGRQRSWIILSYFALIIGILGMAFSTPESGLSVLIFFASLVALADGCKNVALYPYQISKSEKQNLGYVASVVSLGHRIGMIAIKVTTLYVAAIYNWKYAYTVAAILVTISMIIILQLDKPKIIEKKVEPKKIFDFANISLHTILVLSFYKSADFMIQKMSRAFCIEIGFTPIEIANIVQIGGTIAVVIGTFIGGYFVKCNGISKAMFTLGIFHVFSLLLYVFLAISGHNLSILTLAIICEGLTGGAVTSAFISFLYSVSHNGTLYALFWAIHGCSGTLFMMLSGILADYLSWTAYFSIVPLCAIPGLVIVRHKNV